MFNDEQVEFLNKHDFLQVENYFVKEYKLKNDIVTIKIDSDQNSVFFYVNNRLTQIKRYSSKLIHFDIDTFADVILAKIKPYIE